MILLKDLAHQRTVQRFCSCIGIIEGGTHHLGLRAEMADHCGTITVAFFEREICWSHSLLRSSPAASRPASDDGSGYTDN
jgi:hypothetical protein